MSKTPPAASPQNLRPKEPSQPYSIPPEMVSVNNRIILGCMNFGPDPNQGARVTDILAAREILSHLKSSGHGELDTARIYVAGQSESFLAAADYKGLGFKLATKVYPTFPGTHSPKVLRSKVRESLTALRTENVDIFYLHAADRSVPFVDTLQTVNELYNEGCFRTLGLSNYTAFEVAEIVTLCKERGWVRPKIYQAMYNPITRKIEAELVPACRKYGLDIVAYNPLAGGFFTGRYNPTHMDTPPESGRFSNTFSEQGSTYRSRYFNDAHFSALYIVQAAALKENLSLVEISLRWLVHHSVLKHRRAGGNDGIIMGVSSLEQLESNLKDLEKGPLSQGILEALETAWRVSEDVCPTYWRGELKYTYDTTAN